MKARKPPDYTHAGLLWAVSPILWRPCRSGCYRAAAVHATCTHLGNGKVQLDFDTPIRALALGQVCAFYEPDALRGEKLLGGGFFESLG